MKPKAALIKDGKIPTTLGRGRMSAEQIARCKELALMGWDIEGYSVSNPTGDSAPVVEKITVSSNVIADIGPETRPESDFQAYVRVDGKLSEIGMRTVCNRCRRSLCYGLCHGDGGKCRVYVDHNHESEVEFKPRTTPRERWY